ncbi:MAG: SRPBCC family protein [Bacteroidota bacterium]
MRIVKIILLVIVALIVLSAVAGLFMSSKFSMERSTLINADQKVIFDQINNLKNWEQWSPWQKMDPETKITYDGPEAGVGASYSWTSSKNGDGTLTISESIPYESVTTDMDFKENGKGVAGFKIAKEGNGNKLIWWFETDLESNPFKKFFFGMMGESIMSKPFDQGLSDIKKIAESMPSAAPEIIPAVPDTLSADTTK